MKKRFGNPKKVNNKSSSSSQLMTIST